VSEVGDYKLIEAALLLAALVGFGWWQLRDVKRAQDETRRRRAAEEAQHRPGAQDEKAGTP
jgi:hypothetical protein